MTAKAEIDAAIAPVPHASRPRYVLRIGGSAFHALCAGLIHDGAVTEERQAELRDGRVLRQYAGVPIAYALEEDHPGWSLERSA